MVSACANLYELGADEEIVRRVLSHAKSPVTKDRYIKAFDAVVNPERVRIELVSACGSVGT